MKNQVYFFKGEEIEGLLEGGTRKSEVYGTVYYIIFYSFNRFHNNPTF